jgi:hypothetical protein
MGAKSSGWKEIGRDLGLASERIVEDGKKVVGQGCLNIKRDAQRIIRGATHKGYLPHYPRAITYEVVASAATITGTVGPEQARLQGGLGRLLEFGSVNNAPIPHLLPAHDVESPKFERFVAELGVKLLEGGRGPAGPVTDPGGG